MISIGDKIEFETGTLWCGDAREILPSLEADTCIIDPPWPGCLQGIPGDDRPVELFAEIMDALPPSVIRLSVHFGGRSDPRMLTAVPDRLSFFRHASMSYILPGYVGRSLNTHDCAYLFGEPPASRPGYHLVPGECKATGEKIKLTTHPCPRLLDHVKWQIDKWSEPDSVIVDPCAGSGTTPCAAVELGRRWIGIEISPEYCEEAADRICKCEEQGDWLRGIV